LSAPDAPPSEFFRASLPDNYTLMDAQV